MFSENAFRAVLQHPPPKTNFTVGGVRPGKNTGFFEARLDNSFFGQLPGCLSPYQRKFSTMPSIRNKPHRIALCLFYFTGLPKNTTKFLRKMEFFWSRKTLADSQGSSGTCQRYAFFVANG